MSATHPRLHALMARATAQAGTRPGALGLVYPCDALALDAAQRMANSGMARPVLIGPRALIAAAADAAQVDVRDFELIDSGSSAPDAALRACALARSQDLRALMKGSLHTDELMAAVVNKEQGLRGTSRISHAFVFDLPRYHKLLALADCVVNIAPDLKTKKDILGNAVGLLHQLGIAQPKVGIVAAVEVVNTAIPATLDAQALVEMAHAGAWPGAIVEGPFGFDNAFSAEAARIKKIDSQVAGDADLLLMPDLNAGNMLYKSFNYVGGGDCAGLVLGAQVPIVLTSRADSLQSRMASVALAVLAGAPA
jgi:phosphate acetyltransferase/phosphate butyryltransferase